MRNHWYLPLCRRLDITYPTSIRHIIINCAAPIDDGCGIGTVQRVRRSKATAD
jgi:hypothetical protein